MRDPGRQWQCSLQLKRNVIGIPPYLAQAVAALHGQYKRCRADNKTLITPPLKALKPGAFMRLC